MEATNGKKILVTGATGRQGGAAARHLLAEGYPVTALTRKPQKAEAHLLARKGAEIVPGDLEDPASLERVIEGSHGVFGVMNFWEHGYEREIRQGKNLIDAAKATGVRHFVYSSVASADRGTGLSHFESKRVIEEYLKESGLPYTILRPVFFMDNLDVYRSDILEGHLRMPLAPDRKLQMIAVNDIGGFVERAFSHPEAYLGLTLEIAGADLNMAQAAEVFGENLGRDVHYEELPLEALASQPEAAAMFAWFRDRGYQVDVPGFRARHSWMMTFGEWVRAAGWDMESEGEGDTDPVSHSHSPKTYP